MQLVGHQVINANARDVEEMVLFLTVQVIIETVLEAQTGIVLIVDIVFLDKK